MAQQERLQPDSANIWFRCKPLLTKPLEQRGILQLTKESKLECKNWRNRHLRRITLPIGTGPWIEHRCPDTKPRLALPQKIHMLPHDKDGLSICHVLNIELTDTRVQRTRINRNFCSWCSLGIINHQTDNENIKIHVLDKYSKEIWERKQPNSPAKENNHKIFLHKTNKCTQSSNNSSFS